MTTLLIILFVVLVVAGVVVFVRGRQAVEATGPGGLPAGTARTPATEQRSDVRALKVGDVVNHDGGDFIVEGTLRLEQDGFRWEEHRLVDGPRSLWLSVEDDEGLEVVVWDRGRGIELEPGPDSLVHDGVTYALEERGTANFTAEGSTATATGGRVEFVDYGAGENQRLSFERYGEDAGWEVGLGKVVSEHSLDVYPRGDA